MTPQAKKQRNAKRAELHEKIKALEEKMRYFDPHFPGIKKAWQKEIDVLQAQSAAL